MNRQIQNNVYKRGQRNSNENIIVELKLHKAHPNPHPPLLPSALRSPNLPPCAACDHQQRYDIVKDKHGCSDAI